METINEIKGRIIDAALKSIEELIKISEAPILIGGEEDPEPEKLKTAASAKRLCFEDALAIACRIEEEREKIEESKNPKKEKEVVKKADFIPTS